MTSKPFRSGALGALMDEYERAIRDLAQVVQAIGQAEFDRIRDAEAPDEDCRSIRTVLNHVVRSGNGYVGYMRAALGMPHENAGVTVATPKEAIRQMEQVARQTELTFEGDWEMPDAVMEAAKIQTRWGPVYNLEQMFEHAIVHVLRHRRQIERFLQGNPGR